MTTEDLPGYSWLRPNMWVEVDASMKFDVFTEYDFIMANDLKRVYNAFPGNVSIHTLANKPFMWVQPLIYDPFPGLDKYDNGEIDWVLTGGEE